MTLLAQAPVLPIPDIAWSAISPELVLFGTAILVLLLDTAGEQRLQSSFFALAALFGGAWLIYTQSGSVAIAGTLALAGVLQFALTVLWRERPRVLGALLTVGGFAGALVIAGIQFADGLGAVTTADGRALVGTGSHLAGTFALDGVALFTRFTICITGMITVPLGFAYATDRGMHRGEYYPLLLCAATGMTLLAASGDLLMVFLAIEILSLPLYVLSAFAKRDLNSQEGALKYFILGSLSSAVMLYGIAVVYGATGTTNIAAAGRALAAVEAPPGLGLAAMALLLVGFAFKTALVPFHMWTPDVYQGAPTPVVAFMAAGTKAAAFAAFLRVFVGGLGVLQWSWVPVFWVLAILTMLVGAILAVVQTDLKRMLGYSAIAHAGYVMIGLVSVNRDGVSATLLYLLVYAVMSLGSFGVLALLERRSRKAMALDDIRGLGRRFPVPAALFALFLLSLAGIPGTAGFIAKLAVFRAGIEAGHWPLVLVAVVSSVIAAFFYIRVIVAMFMEEPIAADAERPLQPTYGAAIAIGLSAAVMVVLGVLPNALIDLSRQAATFAG